MLKPLVNPIPGSTMAKNCGGYAGDTGLDIHTPEGTIAVAAADGKIIYRERGHTVWPLKDGQMPYSCLVKLDDPFEQDGKTYRFIWYTHLNWVPGVIRDDFTPIPVKRGEVIGKTGWANGVPHLHFGTLTARSQNYPEETMRWEDVAKLIWDNDAPPKSNRTAPIHGHNVKVFHHDGNASIVLDGETIPLNSLIVNGVKIL